MGENSYKEPEIIEPEEKEPVKPVKKRKVNPVVKGIQSVLDGTILARKSVMENIPFVLYIVLLVVLYIANSFYAEKKIIEIEKVKKENKELRSENITSKSRLMFYSRQSEVIKRIEPYGIKESVTPPYKIFIESDTTVKATENND
ncbi:MAG TPA: FtsL-like putative cell division protein [Bacteroidales bacterium]|nr:FtsL-like putative cell division protein [Bacteroidales bacterium]HPS16397.1 FtsL-like putative cell division protein [Bacteroidales bacterium]